MSTIGTLVVQIMGDNSNLVQSVRQSQQVSDSFTQNVETGFGKLQQYNTAFNRAFISGLERGNASLGSFGSMLLNTADNAQLNTGQISEMAAATGMFTKKQLAAGQATANMALKSVELTRAVADGKISAKDAGAEWRRYADTQQVVGKWTVFTKDDLMKLVKTVGIAIASIGALVVVGKKFFSILEEGAGINQTTESFQGLVSQLEDGNQIMDDLERTTAGTVSQLGMMSRVNKALTGTQGEVRQKLAESLPALYEMSRAAVKLAPDIGTVDFVFDSLIRGVRKGSPLLIDNANIMVKAGGANEAYAASVGKTVEELTDEERTLATLNAVLDQHDNLLAQAGNDLNSQVDAYARLKAVLQDATNAGKGHIASFLEPAASAVYMLLTWNQQLSATLSEKNRILQENATSYMEYREGILATIGAIGLLQEEQVKLMAQFHRIGGRLDFLENKFGVLNEKMWVALHREKDITKAIQEDSPVWEQYAGNLTVTGVSARSLEYDLAGSIPTIVDHASAMRGVENSAIAVGGSFEAMGRKAEGAIQPSENLFDTLNVNIASPITAFIEDLDWFIATGGQIEATFAKIKEGYASGALTEEQAKGLAQDLLEVTEDVTAEMGKQTDWEAIQNLEDAGIEAGEARDAIYGTDSVASALEYLDDIEFEVTDLIETYETAKDLHKELVDAAAQEYDIQVNINVSGEIPGTGATGRGIPYETGGGVGGVPGVPSVPGQNDHPEAYGPRYGFGGDTHIHFHDELVYKMYAEQRRQEERALARAEM